ncbi:hypothetical protein [Halovenus marina]|uniref:hypothetical protein n=1 Tax=Halovenus marina TaxID=3396621 RepID=UPI003F548D16
MIADAQSRTDSHAGFESGERPQITICESCPDRFVFIEAENTDGWIASDHTVDIRQ